jgi:hypothetical protein
MQFVGRHLERCTGCTAEFDALRGMQRLLAEHLSVAKAPDDLGLKLRLAISHEKTRVAGALILVGGIAALVGLVAVPNAVLANDEPLGAVTMPHYLYSAAEQQPVLTRDDSTIVVQAQVNAQGRVYDYQIVSGPTDIHTQDEVRDQLMLQVYEPARMFGEPVRGQVLVTFSGVVVHG